MIRILFDEQPKLTQLLNGNFPSFKSIKSHQGFTRQPIHHSVRIDDIHHRQSMPLPNREVHFIMSRCHLQNPRAKLKVNLLIPNDRHHSLRLRNLKRKWPNHFLPNQMRITHVMRIHRHCRIARNRFRSRRRNRQPSPRLPNHLHLKVIHRPILRLHHDFLIRQRSQRCRTPVDHSLPPINQALFVKIHKDSLHALRVIRVHGEALARPITRATQLLQLLNNDPPVLLFPLPDLLQKSFPTKIIPMPNCPLLF